MNAKAITMLTWLGLVALAATPSAAQPSGKAESSSAPSQTQLSEVRALVRDLQGQTEKLRDLMGQYASLIEQRPQGEAKKSQDEQLAKWNAALERLLQRVDVARVAVTETTRRLSQIATAQLPTALAKDVANAHNEAEAQRTAAEQALAKKRAPVRASKPAKDSSATDQKPPPNRELDDLDEP